MRFRSRILVVDDLVDQRRAVADDLTCAGHLVDAVEGHGAAMEKTRRHLYDLVLSDLGLEQRVGFALLKRLRALDPDLPVLITAAPEAVDGALTALKLGAWHYVTKPYRFEEVSALVDRALEERQLRSEHRTFQRLAGERSSLGTMVGRSEPMQRLFERMERVARGVDPVLISGEAGTGKDLIARAIHFEGPRRNGPFVAISCAGLPEALLEAELFGQVKGAFSEATVARQGLFTAADQGTLLLDDVSELSPPLQARILELLATGLVRAVGAEDARPADVRLIATTRKELGRKVRAGTFREDLWHRLCAAPLAVPPLRERGDDVLLLIELFVAAALARNPGSLVRSFSPDLVAALARHSWPGNVRELENLVERLVITGAAECLTSPDLDLALDEATRSSPRFELERPRVLPLGQVESEYIAWAVAQCDGDRAMAASLLGVEETVLSRPKPPGARSDRSW